MNLSIYEGKFAVCKFSPGDPIPEWIDKSKFWTVCGTDEELSIVCSQDCVKDATKAENDWRIIKVAGPLDFGLTGILASIASPLAEAKVSIFAISTFDTDYVLVRTIV